MYGLYNLTLYLLSKNVYSTTGAKTLSKQIHLATISFLNTNQKTSYRTHRENIKKTIIDRQLVNGFS